MKTPITLSKLPGISHDHPQATWLVGPVGQHRDSDTVERSNFEVTCAALAKLDPDGLDHEVHRFGHWAVGWVEEIAYRPGSVVASEADSICERLEGYPILNDDHHSQLEYEEETHD